MLCLYILLEVGCLLELMLGQGGHHVLGGEGLVEAILTIEPVGGHCSFTLDAPGQTDRQKVILVTSTASEKGTTH